MRGSVRALKAVPSYTIPIVREIKSNNTQKYTHTTRVKVNTYTHIHP